MSAFDELAHEHKHIMRMLKVIDHTIEHIKSNRPVPIEIVQDELDFIKGFADQCHHGKEEGVLFKMIELRLSADQKETMNSLIKDHIDGRNFVKNAREDLAQAGGGNTKAANALADDLKSYANLLRSHLRTESVFFREIKTLLDEKQMKVLNQECERIEKELGEHGHFLEMLDRLEASEILRK